MNLSNQTKKEIIQKFYDLFIVPKYKYLIMYPNGQYQTCNKYDKKQKNFKPLRYWQFESHLNNDFTIGVFASNYLTKFICFDVDIIDPVKAKWAVYKLIDVLTSIGVPQDYIYISTSGNKGYHVDIYFNETIQNNIVKDFYNIVMSQMDMSEIDGQIELRPTQQGLKLPLGTNFKNKDSKTNKCWYVDFDKGLKPIRSYKYILDIKQIDSSVINDIMLEQTEMLIIDNSVKNEEAEQIEESKGHIDSKYKPLINYEIGSNEQVTIEYYQRIEKEGIKQIGTRNKLTMKLCRYYKFLGMTPEENINSLKVWMDQQDPKTYRTSLDDSYKEIENIVKYAYEKDVSFTIEHKEIYISYQEMLFIMKANSKNEKLLLYAMMIHSKKYSQPNGHFYMTYNQMVELTSISSRTVKRLVNKLEYQSLIEIPERNRKVLDENGKLLNKKPNIYKINYININDETNKLQLTDTTNFNDIVTLLFTDDELKKLLPRRHYEELRSTVP